MRLVAISDTHNQHKKITIPDGDILVHAGDACGSGTFREMADFLTWFSGQPHPYKIYVPGNHCRYAQESAFRGIVPDNVICLIDQSVSILGYKFYGSPWTPEFSIGWAFNKPRGEELCKTWAKIPEDTEVLITHGPPHGILDTVVQDNGAHLSQGCEELRKVVLAMSSLKVHVFGHIHVHHNQMSQMTVNNTKFVNASQLNDRYEIANPPVGIDL